MSLNYSCLYSPYDVTNGRNILKDLYRILYKATESPPLKCYSFIETLSSELVSRFFLKPENIKRQFGPFLKDKRTFMKLPLSKATKASRDSKDSNVQRFSLDPPSHASNHTVLNSSRLIKDIRFGCEIQFIAALFRKNL